MSKIIQDTIKIFNPITTIVYEKNTKAKINKVKGQGVSDQIGECLHLMGVKKPLIVTDQMLVKLGLLNPMLNSIKKSELDYVIFDGVKPDPTVEICEIGVTKLLENKCDGVISFGGGSSLDAGKVISGLAKNPEFIGKPKKYMGMQHLSKFKRSKGTLPIITVPTTAGTGAEVTIGAVIGDTESHKKGIVMDNGFISRYVFLDTTLTMGLPSHITATTGIDAFSHAIEAYISGLATENSKANSISAIKTLLKYLPIATKDGLNVEAREEILNAAHLAGLAIGRCHIGSIHAIGHNVGGTFGIPHGFCIAAVLPHIMELDLQKSKKCKKDFAEIAVNVGLATEENSDTVAATLFVHAVKELLVTLNIPAKLKNLDENKFDEVANAAIKEGYLYPIPRYVTKKEMLIILNKIKA
jgi:alcohol dehydrogenase